MSTVDYSNKTMEELKAEVKKLDNGKLLTGVLIGILIGALIYRIATRGFGLVAVAFPVAFILIFGNNMKTQTENLKALKEEIAKRSKEESL